ncbi:MAG TPA: hypothetical protein VFE69_11225 [Ilumatobacteraceae bacterium]|nr:hypothetical protein [Ilumatobacteraceae bacterium]
MISIADKLGARGVGRLVIDVDRLSLLQKSAFVQNGDAIGEKTRLVAVVGDEQDRTSLLVDDGTKISQEFEFGWAVQRIEGFVEKQQSRAKRQCTCNAQALCFAT